MSASLSWLVLAGVGSPAAMLAILACASFIHRPLRERWTAALVEASMLTSCGAFGMALIVHGTGADGIRLLSYGAWSDSFVGGVPIAFLVDRLSLGFATVSAAILGIVSAFSNRYLHREPGYNRYFVLLAMFATGMLFIAVAGNVEVLLIGWEFIGLSSALLVGFFHERAAPVSNALRVFSVYRVSDAAMLSAAVLLRHTAGTDSLALLFSGAGALPAGGLTPTAATTIAVLLIVAVAGKSALLPFSGWLPRAMEGPTPSSAVYYGSLAIHAGCFLLLRSAPLFERAAAARVLAGGLGAATAIFAAIATRVQSDVKSSLAYAALTQVGIIVVEIAVGWYTIAFVHIIGHACFRLLQFLSAPNVLHDLHGMADPSRARTAPSPTLFLVAIERGFLDTTLDRVVVDPFMRLARRLTLVDRWLCGTMVVADVRQIGPDGEDRDE